jgi:hypothetical protein
LRKIKTALSFTLASALLKAMNHGHERVFSERAELARLQAILTKTGRRTSKKLREF